MTCSVFAECDARVTSANSDVRNELEYNKDEEDIVNTSRCVFAVPGDLFCTEIVLSDLPLQPSYRCWRTVCVQKFLKAAIILLLFLVHISSTFYYLWIGEEPNIFAMIALTSVAVYIYLIFFLLTFVLIQSVFRRMLRMNSKHFRFLRFLFYLSCHHFCWVIFYIYDYLKLLMLFTS
ncbi:unnamed protein product [Wuchereria bancrofti]|uniref:Uncharacterized protein n=1 Tax=Wuchereria bancrofti TaxID=6293 RepID=A0A3P7EG41_WUCBA|nr:unnamed protein product [Wuchereria bancrofti]